MERPAVSSGLKPKTGKGIENPKVVFESIRIVGVNILTLTKKASYTPCT
jgi:hypothetical protein